MVLQGVQGLDNIVQYRDTLDNIKSYGSISLRTCVGLTLFWNVQTSSPVAHPFLPISHLTKLKEAEVQRVEQPKKPVNPSILSDQMPLPVLLKPLP